MKTHIGLKYQNILLSSNKLETYLYIVTTNISVFPSPCGTWGRLPSYSLRKKVSYSLTDRDPEQPYRCWEIKKNSTFLNWWGNRRNLTCACPLTTMNQQVSYSLTHLRIESPNESRNKFADLKKYFLGNKRKPHLCLPIDYNG